MALVILAEYGAFEILGYQTFTTEIFTEFNIGFSPATACALSLVLVVVSLVVLVGEGASRGAGRVSRTGLGRPAGRGPQAPRKSAGPGPCCLRAARPRRPRGCRRIVHLLDLRGRGARTSEALRSPRRRFTRWATACRAALVATVMALPGRSARGPPSRVVCTSSRSGRPSSSSPCRGWSSRSRSPTSRPSTPTASAYQTAPLLVLAYSIMFFPLALVCVRASVAQSPGRS